MKQFDLNIEKILENWETYHAIREIISNALDEQLLTNTKDVEITKNNDNWLVRDYGRGLKYTNLTQNENKEKLENPNVIGKFGIGLKDALATFDRKGIKVLAKSQYGDITLSKTAKEGFADIITLHASISEPTDPNFIGTEFIIDGATDEDILKAKNLFLKFTGEQIIETTKAGSVINKMGNTGKIYINGVRVAEEENFLFSYNITLLTTAIKKSLNRERSNVGRTAYTDSVKKILLGCASINVAKMLADDLQNINHGTAHDELSWIDVQEHSVKILNQNEKVLFVSSTDIMLYPDMIEEAKESGHQIIIIPENLKEKIKGGLDFSGNPIIDISQFATNYNESFSFEFVEINDLTKDEREIFNLTDKILNLIGGKPRIVRDIKISTTMHKDFFSENETVGIWESSTSSIIILRKMLNSVRDYAGTLIHEAIHAKSGLGDISRNFEHELTTAIGQVCEKALEKKKKWW
ncbi:MAG: ATP-binding protein [Saprospiraceae bacterium]|nr:ATP-binding protein [Saprospiraceae bacterium]